MWGLFHTFYGLPNIWCTIEVFRCYTNAMITEHDINVSQLFGDQKYISFRPSLVIRKKIIQNLSDNENFF